MKNQNKQIIIWILIFIMMVITFNTLQGGSFAENKEKLSFSEFLTKVDEHAVSSVKIQGRNIEGTLSNGMNFSTLATDYPGLIDKLSSNGVFFEVAPLDTKMNALFSIFVSWFPMLLLIGVWVFFMRQMQGGGKGMGFGKSKAKLMNDKGKKITFGDVAGIDEAKEELSEIVDFLRNPGKFQAIGGKIPKGCLLVGPPGTGKTLLAKAIAGEANVPFFSISGSEFVEMFVGIGASRVRDMFEQGRANAPCIIFIDEIDAMGRSRGIGLGGGNDEREQTLNQMLVEMDGFDSKEGVIIVAATNRPDVLDKALLRPGRFDRQITVSPPTMKGREEILKVHMKKIKFSDEVDPKVVARGTPGFTGAQLQNLVNEAALMAARLGKKIVDQHDFEHARDKVLMGPEWKSLAMTGLEKERTAYHEAGHALVSLYAPSSDPIHKATILPRGRALGMVQSLPENDSVSKTVEQYESQIAIFMAGKAAEEIIYGPKQVTSGAASDIKGATHYASAMIKEFGQSEKLGNVYHGESADMYVGEHSKGYSESTAEIIDQEIRRLIDEGYQFAKATLIKNKAQLEKLAKALMEFETLSGKQIKNLLLGNDMNAKDDPKFPGKKNSKKNKEKDDKADEDNAK